MLYYVNGHHKQYIQVQAVDIFNYMFHFGLLGSCLYTTHIKMSLSGADRAGARKVHFANFYEDMFWSPNVMSTLIYCLWCPLM